ncbi:Ribonuclease HII [Clarias magur]|uniref:Ribonuclease HII n=1 Tax=Clarias magur TaxID=1594786 RepID=A0A8J4U986_CLAMG|nr:Ribonuclease HII [Clarias magur]
MIEYTGYPFLNLRRVVTKVSVKAAVLNSAGVLRAKPAQGHHLENSACREKLGGKLLE